MCTELWNHLTLVCQLQGIGTLRIWFNFWMLYFMRLFSPATSNILLSVCGLINAVSDITQYSDQYPCTNYIILP